MSGVVRTWPLPRTNVGAVPTLPGEGARLSPSIEIVGLAGAPSHRTGRRAGGREPSGPLDPIEHASVDLVLLRRRNP